MAITALAFDFGTKSIGCAVGQSITGTAQALPAFKAQDGIPDWNQIEKCLREWRPDVIVVGLPLNMDGSSQDLTLRAKKFANRLQGRFGIKVILQDERLTTTQARSEIFERGGYRALNKGKIDGISACLILESWFDNAANEL
ncbi:putative Holliday junction resolvase [Mesocricetibacter intestinalis]|uniref:Putative pre-16S rRNA nuclease n=1 Tax=Mesocricetibacter intestinalis TaxID=1521930 RepID=A0A4R6V852_9PAST|nr:Holliday junction resolvase RuvX [Mesocricetibacter intestinalis]TDQ57622.1 putative Holliday junction resolvase [Mesocricetibacter intestinalis]